MKVVAFKNHKHGGCSPGGDSLLSLMHAPSVPWVLTDLRLALTRTSVLNSKKIFLQFPFSSSLLCDCTTELILGCNKELKAFM